MKKLVVGVDVDGLLSDFNSSYKVLLEKMTDLRFPDITDYFPNTWNWDIAAGLTQHDKDEVWQVIEASTTFWRDLQAYPEAREFLTGLWSMQAFGGDVYFVTNRPGWTAKRQTEHWLSIHGYENPTVILSSEKGLVAKSLKLTHYIDDRNQNCQDVQYLSKETNGFMLARPWNQDVGVPRIDQLDKFLEILKDFKDEQ